MEFTFNCQRYIFYPLDDDSYRKTFTKKEVGGVIITADFYPLILGILILVSSLISLRAGISVAIVEIILGVIFGNLGFIKPESWMLYIAGFGGILLTFLAGTEIDMDLMGRKLKESFLIGFVSFFVPFLGVLASTYCLAGWNLTASLIAATALSETSIAVVYSVLVETSLCKSETGKLLMVATFITNMGTAIVLSILFIRPSVYTLLFYIISILAIFLASKYSLLIFENPKIKDKVVEAEIKYIFLILLVFIFFASLGGGQAILPAFLLGLFMSRHFQENSQSREVKTRLKTVAFAIITPIFFIVGGMKVSIPFIIAAAGIFIVIFLSRQISKFIGVYFVAKRFLDDGQMYTTLMMSTGLTFGLVACLFGLNAGLIDQATYSVLTGVLVLSAVLPSFVAQRWFLPIHSEDHVAEKVNKNNK